MGRDSARREGFLRELLELFWNLHYAAKRRLYFQVMIDSRAVIG